MRQTQETSIDAFHAHRGAGHSSAQRERILAFIEKKGGNWSIGELARELRLEKSTVSARVNELLHSNKVIGGEKRKDRVSGIRIRPVALPPKQWRLMA